MLPLNDNFDDGISVSFIHGCTSSRHTSHNHHFHSILHEAKAVDSLNLRLTAKSS